MPMASSRAAGTFERGGGGAEGYETAGGASLMARLALGAPRGVGACRRRGGPLAPRPRPDELQPDEPAHGGLPQPQHHVRVGHAAGLAPALYPLLPVQGPSAPPPS